MDTLTVTSVTASTPPSAQTERQRAEAAAAAARAEYDAWARRVQEQQARAREVAASLDDVARELAEQRVAALRDEQPLAAVADLLAHKRDLEDEAHELAERIVVAQAEAARSHEAMAEADRALTALQVAELQAQRVARSEQLYSEIGSTYRRLAVLLNEYADLSQGSVAMARAGLPVGPISFSWSRILAHPNTPRCRIPFPSW